MNPQDIKHRSKKKTGKKKEEVIFTICHDLRVIKVKEFTVFYHHAYFFLRQSNVRPR